MAAKTIVLDNVEKPAVFLENPQADLTMMRDAVLPMAVVRDAIDRTHRLIGQFKAFDVDVFALLGMRNLSAFVGEVFAAQMILAAGAMFRKNPHQDGYPDLLLMDDVGQAAWAALDTRLKEKGPFSPFVPGGIEVKATCGDLPTPAICARKGVEKPGMGEQRIDLLKGYTWKAHHRETNHLIGLFWDFIKGAPHIVGVFYSSNLTPDHWGKIVQPKEGGGKTTSVSIMTRAGVREMCESWLIMLDDDRYKTFFSKYNGGVAFT